MKLDFTQSNVLGMAGMGAARVSQMKASPLAFDILSKRIYKNKIKAPIQELACNAQDAHKLVGQPNRPIEIKLPNALDPEFYVQDWGPGLSEDEVMNLYMTYFMSTKSDSDDFTGAFGLGSKSPFSYCDHFVVTSAQNGVQTSYVAFRDNQGMPSVSKVEDSTMASPADWQSGLRVGFPAAEGDFARFAQECAAVVRWFSVKPVVRGAYKEFAHAFFYDAEHFSILAVDETVKHKFGYTAQSYVQMGSVGYPVELDSLQQLSAEHKALLVGGLVIKVGIGEVSVTASRESLEYDGRTMDALVRKLDSITATIARECVANIGVDPAKRQLNTMMAGLAPFRSLCLRFGSESPWTVSLVEAVVQAIAEAAPLNPLPQKTVSDFLCKTFLTAPGWMGNDFATKVAVYEPNRSRFTQKTVHGGRVGRSDVTFALDAALAVVIDDVSYAAARCKLALSEKTYGNIIFVSNKNKEAALKVATRIAEHFCNIPVLKASSLPKGPDVYRAPSYRGKSSTGPSVRIKPEDRLAHFANEDITLGTPNGTTVVTLKDALALTSAYAHTNFTSCVVRNVGQTLTMHFNGVANVLKALPLLHPSFAQEKRGYVMLLSSTQIQKFKAETCLDIWETRVTELMRQHKAEISARLRKLPGYAPALAPHGGSTELPRHAVHDSETLLATHYSTFVTGSAMLAQDEEGVPAVTHFFDALVPDLRDHLVYLTASMGLAYDGKSKWSDSASKLAYSGLVALEGFVSGASDLYKPLVDDVTWVRDIERFARIKAQCRYFGALSTRNYHSSSFTQESSVFDIAEVYNAMWKLGAGDIAQFELKLAA